MSVVQFLILKGAFGFAFFYLFIIKKFSVILRIIFGFKNSLVWETSQFFWIVDKIRFSCIYIAPNLKW
jgi:hypothetical protein